MGKGELPLYPTDDWIAVRVAKNSSVKAARARVAAEMEVDEQRQPSFSERYRILMEPVKRGRARKLAPGRGIEREVRAFHNGTLPPIVETHEILVRFKPTFGRDQIDALLAPKSATIVRPLGDYAPNAFLIQVDEAVSSIDLANELADHKQVIYSYPNFIWPKETKFVPNDVLYPQQWHLDNTGSNGPAGGLAGADIKAQRAWEITRGSSNVVVAIVDDGVNTTHEDFSSTNKIQPGWDFVDNDNTPFPDPALDSLADTRRHNNHGTACAGLAVANGNNLLGGSGVAPGCRLMSVRLLGANMTPDTEAAAILSARDNGATIISNSWGPPDRAGPGNTSIAQPCPQNVFDAIREVATTGRNGKGCIVLFAAGNGNESVDLDGYASHPDVICVAASNNQDRKASYSDFGDAIDVCAPGSEADMVTTDRMGSAGYDPGNYTFNFNGTSAATPVAAGVCALLLSREPNLTRQQVYQRLIDTADFVDTANVTYDSNGHHAWYGFGRVNAWKALAEPDTTAPTVSIRVPAEGISATSLTTADGTAADVGLGVYRVQVALRNSGNFWWNWKSGAWSASTAFDADTNYKDEKVSSGKWTASLPPLGDGNYIFFARTLDKADNPSVIASTTFTIDTSGPAIHIAHPQENSNHSSLTHASGTAYDNIQEKRFALYSRALGRWYNWGASNFDSGTFHYQSHVLYLLMPDASWTVNLPALDAGLYEFHALAIDQSGRSSDWQRRNFRIGSPPEIAVHTPLHGSGIQELTSIGGTAHDPAGVGFQGGWASFTLYNDGSYWNGSSWTPTQTTLHAPISGGAWNYTSVPSGAQERSGVYYVSAFVVDNTGATSASLPGVNQTSFRIDRTPPDVAVSAPAHGSVIAAQNYQFGGTATDAGGVAAVHAFIRRASDSLYWNGSGWGPSPVVLASDHNPSTGEWLVPSGLPILRGSANTQMPNGTYHFIAIAIDHAGNYKQTDSVITVDYHQVFHWTAGSYGDGINGNENMYWDNPANWSPNGVPADEDIVHIALHHGVRSSTSRNVHEFHLSAGGLDFDGSGNSLTVKKAFHWTAGSLEDRLTIPAGAICNISGSANKQLGHGMVVENSGVTTWSGPGVIIGYQSSVWNNLPGSSFLLAGDGDVFGHTYGGNAFHNHAGAVFAKTAGGEGAAASSIDHWEFHNAGLIDSRQGTLRFDTTLHLNAGSALAGAGRVALGGTTNLATLLQSTGNPELTGTLNGNTPAAGFSGSAPLVWSSGGINGTFTLQAGSVLDLASGNVKQLGHGAVFTNHGRTNYQAGRLRGYQSSTFLNEAGGVFDCTTDGDVFDLVYGGNSFHNKAGALFLKSGRSADPQADTRVDNWSFHNSGTIRSDDGVIRIDTQLHLSGGGTILRSGQAAARVVSAHSAELTGTTTVSNITFETSGNWHGNTAEGTAGNGTIATANNGAFEWTGGTVDNTVNIAPGAAFLISGPAVKQIGYNAVVNLSGDAVWTGEGELRGYQSGLLRAMAGSTFGICTDADFTYVYGGTRFVIEAGAAVTKTGGTDLTHCGWAVENAGSISVESGVLALGAGGDSSDGVFAAAAGSELRFQGGHHNIRQSATIAGAGKVRVTGGTVFATDHVAADVTSGTLEIAAGTLGSDAAGSFDVSGRILWTGGTIGGTFHAAAGSTFDLSGSATKAIAHNGVIHNHGDATWTGPGTLQGVQTSSWYNKSGSTFAVLGDGDLFSNYYSGNAFHNEEGAVFSKNDGASDATSLIDDWAFHNAGTLDSREGTLHFNTTLGLAPGSQLAGSGRVLLGGTTNLSTVLSSTGNPELIGWLNANTADAGFSGTQPLVWTSGGINGTFTLQSGSEIRLVSTALKDLGYGAVFTNKGRVTYLAGVIRGYQNCAIRNESGAVFDATTDGDLFGNYYSGNLFENKAGALFLKSGRSAAPDGSTYVDEWTFRNAGEIRVTTGLVHFHTSVELTGGGSIARDGTADARVLSTHSFVLSGTTTIHNIVFETRGDWHGSGAAATLATGNGGRFEWTGGTAHNELFIAPGALFSIAGDGRKDLSYGAILHNGGNATWTGAGEIRGIQNSRFLNEGSLAIRTGAAFTNYYSGNRLTNSGLITIGDGIGVCPVHWDFTQTATGTLAIEVGGADAATPEFDQLLISGHAQLDGTLAVSLVNGYAPAADTAHRVVAYSSHSGGFATIAGEGTLWAGETLANGYVIRASGRPVRFADWQTLYFENSSAADAQPGADPDRDGLPNLIEYALGLQPHAGDGAATAATTVTDNGQRYLALRYTRPAGDAALQDISYLGLRSSGLATWSDVGVVVHSVVPGVDAGWETVTLRSTQPFGAGPEFLQLKIVRQEP